MGPSRALPYYRPVIKYICARKLSVFAEHFLVLQLDVLLHLLHQGASQRLSGVVMVFILAPKLDHMQLESKYNSSVDDDQPCYKNRSDLKGPS